MLPGGETSVGKRQESASFLTRKAVLHLLLSRGEREHLGSRAAHRQDKQGQRMQEADHPSSQLSRVINFSDSDFAFAITLMVIIFPFQTFPPGQFLQHLYDLRGTFLAYLVSFYSVGLFWFAHHRYFRYILKFDTGLFVINLVVLMFIALLPFPTYLLELKFIGV
jgi:hypothetical protein